VFKKKSKLISDLELIENRALMKVSILVGNVNTITGEEVERLLEIASCAHYLRKKFS
jgi:hypothetical protein